MSQPASAKTTPASDTTTGAQLLLTTRAALQAQGRYWQISEEDLNRDATNLRFFLLQYGLANNKLTDAHNFPTTTTLPAEPATRDDLATLTRLVYQLSTDMQALKTGLAEQVLHKVLESVHVDLDAKLSPVTARVVALEKELQETNQSTAMLQQEIGRLQARCSLLDKAAVQVDDAAKKERSCWARLTNFTVVAGENLKDRVQAELVQGKLGLSVTVVSAVRQEVKKRSYAVGSSKEPERDVPAPVLIEFATAEDRLTVLKARRKLQGTRWGLEEDLTPLQQSKKRAAWPAFKEAKAAGKKAYWRAEKLFINDREVQP